MEFVKEEREENTSEPETRIKQEEPETWKMEHEEPETWKIEHEEPETWKIEHEEPETWKIEHEEPETWKIEHEEQETWKIEHEEQETQRIAHEEQETQRIAHKESETCRIKLDQGGAKPGTEQTNKARGPKTKMPTLKDCYSCRRKIGVASKTCSHCRAKQPYKQMLEKRKKQLTQEWKDRQKKNSSVNKVYDATNLLLHKWELLERFPVLLLARRTSNGFSAECFCPWKTETEDTQDTFLTIKRSYESLLNESNTDKDVRMEESSDSHSTETQTPPADSTHQLTCNGLQVEENRKVKKQAKVEKRRRTKEVFWQN
ncbi:histone H3.v1 isoform X1 [Carassius gibelio]|uniref:histone H3.v1 isoform X1 n=2 Tax=Carassius gibelio TaxID=101364 RepID=UPI002277A0B1|nr:histone H3.v1 isoform X1 [Carassius gibelio]